MLGGKHRQPVHEKEFIHYPPKILTHMHILIKVYDLASSWDPVFDLAKYEKQVCVQLYPYPELYISLIRGM